MLKNYRLLPESPYSTYQVYLEKNGASGILKARSLSPQAIVDEIQESGLRGIIELSQSNSFNEPAGSAGKNTCSAQLE